MIFVSGTKRSGTSMWMQILAAAGMPVLGQAFPRNWEKSSLKEANRDGFYESQLRHGVYFRTNPHPVTGQYFLPEHVLGYAVKVFVPGVVRSERAYIELLVANVREWREYEASILRLYALEDGDRKVKAPDAPEPFRFPPAFEWWMENFALVRDISLRGYPYRLQTYDEVLSDARTAIGRVLSRIHGSALDIDKAVAAVKPENRTQQKVESSSVDPEFAAVFDELYLTVQEKRPFAGPFLARLNETNKRMIPVLLELQRKVVESAAKMNRKGVQPIPVDGLPDLS
jgi:hypothetical protein